MNEDLTNKFENAKNGIIHKIKNSHLENDFKDILEDLSIKIIDYNKSITEKKFEEIKKSFFEKNDFNIYNFLVSLNDFNKNYHSATFDIKEYEDNKIINYIKKHDWTFYKYAFFEGTYYEIKKLVEKNYFFSGKIKDEIIIEARIIKNNDHKINISKLYDNFRKNNIPWKNLFIPYAEKMFEVEIKCDQNIENINFSIEDIKIDFKEYNDKIKLDKISVWNLKKTEYVYSSSPICLDNKYKYTIFNDEDFIFDFENMNVENFEIEYDRENKNVYLIVNKEQKNIEINIIEFLSKEKYKDKKGILGNELCEEIRFPIIKELTSRGDIEKYINSFKIFREFEFTLENYEIKNTNEKNITYEIPDYYKNDFYYKNINKKLFLILKFKSESMPKLVKQDILNTLITELQRYFREYVLIGEIV